MVVVVTEAFGVVMHIPGEIGFNADDGINPSRFTRLVKLDGTVHSAMVSDGEVIHPQRPGLLYQFLCAAKTI